MRPGGSAVNQATNSASMADAAAIMSWSSVMALAWMSARRLDNFPMIIIKRLLYASPGRKCIANFVHSMSDSGTWQSLCIQLMICIMRG